MLASHIGIHKRATGAPPSSAPALTVNVTTDQTNFNLFTAAGSPGTAKTVTVNISSGVVIRSNATGTPAFNEGTGWASGTSVIINNLGSIYGMAGAGGNGGNGFMDNPSPPFGSATAGTAGSAGGPALKLTVPTTIDNSSGFIFGGGGGGGGAGGAYVWDPFVSEEGFAGANGGGGGGGGQGANASSAGSGGTASAPGIEYWAHAGSAGTTGSSSAGGAGGAGGTSDPDGYIWSAGAGGAGSAWGTAGSAGVTPSAPGNADPLIPGQYYGWGASGAGGAAGKAIDLNGQAITWLSGNDSTHVKGAVA